MNKLVALVILIKTLHTFAVAPPPVSKYSAQLKKAPEDDDDFVGCMAPQAEDERQHNPNISMINGCTVVLTNNTATFRIGCGTYRIPKDSGCRIVEMSDDKRKHRGRAGYILFPWCCPKLECDNPNVEPLCKERDVAGNQVIDCWHG